MAAPARGKQRRRFQSLPIRVKLIVIIVCICFAALFITSLLEMGLNWTSGRTNRMTRLAITADIISLQSRAALQFVDPIAAKENLASLKPDPAIRKACIYDESGRIFAFYIISPAVNETCPLSQHEERRFNARTLEVFQNITFNGRKLGSIYLERSLDDMYARLIEDMLYRLAIIAVVILFVWLLSYYLQRTISQPIIELAEISRRFSKDRSQLIHATRQGDNELGELVDAFNTMMDEIRRNEKQLEEAISTLTRSNTELERFAYICSHDLQEPLRMVSNYSTILQKRYGPLFDEEAAQYFHYIIDGATRMRELINDILDYSRISNNLEPMQPVNLNRLMEYIRQNLHTSIDERNAQIHCDDLPEVLGNKTLLMQIFQNLISNAIKFSTHDPEVWITARRRENAWEFQIRDNGIGIDPKYHDKIFEVFKRLNRREAFQGTGIGLAICKKAVMHHNGVIWLESEVDKGSSFFFTIPDRQPGTAE